MKNYIFAIYILIIIGSVYGQNVRATVESSEVYLGQPFEYRIIIEGTSNSQAPTLDPIDGIRIQYKGVSTSMVSSFGLGSNSSTKTVTHSWSFTPTRKGTLIIPSFTIDIEGKNYKTASGSITVKSPEPIDGFHLILESEKENYWFGEPINLTIKWLVSTELLTQSKVSLKSINVPFINNGQFIVESQDPLPGSNISKININGLDVLAMQGAEIYEGMQYSAISFGLRLLPENIGKFDLGPISLVFDSYQISSGYTSLVIPSNKLTLNIADLPAQAYEQGKPIILSLGELFVEATASPLKVHIGDPLTYSINFKGSVTPELLEIPLLQTFPEMEKNFSIPERRSPGIVENDTVTFSQTIRVRNNGVREIPKLQIKYFNLAKGVIEIATIDSIDLDVLDTDIITSADLESTGYISKDNPSKLDLISNDQGIAINFPTEILLRSNKTTKESILSSPIYWVLFLIPIFTFLGVLVFKNRLLIELIMEKINGNNSDLKRRYREIISKKNYTVEIIKPEIYNYLLSLIGCIDKELTPEEIFRHLIERGNNVEVAHKLRDILRTIEEIEYSEKTIEPDMESLFNDFFALTGELQ